MAKAGHDDPAAVARSAAAIVSRLDQRLAEVTGSIQQTLVTEIAELRDDAQLLQLLRDSVEGNVATVFSAIRHAIPIEKVELPTAALEHARRLAQRGVTVNALVRAYRLGHKAVLDAVLDEIRASELEPPLSLAVFSQISEITFGYIDWITQQVVSTYQSEHDRWMENRNSLRALRVRELLDGVDLDIDAVTTAIRYPLRRTHLAVVAWRDEDDGGDDLASMERFVDQLAESAGARECSLFISVDRLTGWAWIPVLPDAAPEPSLGFARSRRHESDAPGSPSVIRCRVSRVSGVRISRRTTPMRSRSRRAQRTPGHCCQRSRPVDRGACGRQPGPRRGSGSPRCSVRSHRARKTMSDCAKHWESFCAPVGASKPRPRNSTFTQTPSSIAYSGQSSVVAGRSLRADSMSKSRCFSVTGTAMPSYRSGVIEETVIELWPRPTSICPRRAGSSSRSDASNPLTCSSELKSEDSRGGLRRCWGASRFIVHRRNGLRSYMVSTSV